VKLPLNIAPPPAGFTYLGTGPLKKKHFTEQGEILLIWLKSKSKWEPIDCQGAATAHYAARIDSEAHRENV
jgi:hypothetical protein